MATYDDNARRELERWQQEMVRSSGLFERATRDLQVKINTYIPERVRETITAVMTNTIRAVLTGSLYTAPVPLKAGTLQERETLVAEKIQFYRKAAAAEGGITGAGGFLLGLADFPLLLGIKFKLLFEIAALFGYSTDDYKERVHLLHVFQLAFASRDHRRETYFAIEDWSKTSNALPSSLDEFDWRTLQQQYRDYIDLAKLAQLVPVIGAPVGAVVNYRLIDRLGLTAINAYRMRWFASASLLPNQALASASAEANGLRHKDSVK